jgi:hypothetical protein
LGLLSCIFSVIARGFLENGKRGKDLTSISVKVFYFTEAVFSFLGVLAL